MSSDYQRDVSQYKYSAMSNLVLQVDRRFVTRRTDEATGDPESIAGRLSIRDMGSRVARDIAPKKKTGAMPDVERGSFRDSDEVVPRDKRKAKADLGRGGGILSGNEALIDGLRYRPRTQPTRDAFNVILRIVADNLGDVPHEVVRSAADAALEYLKDDDLKDFDKKKEIDDILGVSLMPKQFNELVNLGKKITDYDAQDEDEGMQDANQDEELDDRQGVAVDFGDEDEEDGMVDEVREQSSEDEDEDEDEEDRPDLEEVAKGGEAGQDRDEEGAGLVDGDAMIIDSAPASKRSKK